MSACDARLRVADQLDPLGLRPSQYFYMVVLSSLLMHYAIDGYMFAVSARPSATVDTLPYSAPLERPEVRA